jgi:predicted RNase H-like HicB family nuclease
MMFSRIQRGTDALSYRGIARFRRVSRVSWQNRLVGRTRKMARYVVLVDGKPGAYGIVVPDLPGCTSGAATMDDALTHAAEAIRLWAEDALADGEKLPKPRSAEQIRKDRDVAKALAHGAALAVVPLIMDSGRPAKANLSLDSGLLNAIDEAAASRGLTRSSFLASAAREKIEHDS